MHKRREGFTLIELLIVIVIIGILAAIAIPKFGATREKAYLKAMMSDLRNMHASQEIYYSDNNYSYTTDVADLDDFSLSRGVSIVPSLAGTGSGWSAVADHDATDKSCFIYVGDATAPSGAPAGLPQGVVGCTGDSFEAAPPATPPGT
jgi:prepilin-type N-terminal cleavage/methylation domain-containing protein